MNLLKARRIRPVAEWIIKTDKDWKRRGGVKIGVDDDGNIIIGGSTFVALHHTKNQARDELARYLTTIRRHMGWKQNRYEPKKRKIPADAWRDWCWKVVVRDFQPGDGGDDDVPDEQTRMGEAAAGEDQGSVPKWHEGTEVEPVGDSFAG